MASLRERNNQWTQPTPRLEISASGQPRHSAEAGVSLRQVGVGTPARKGPRPFSLPHNVRLQDLTPFL